MRLVVRTRRAPRLKRRRARLTAGEAREAILAAAAARLREVGPDGLRLQEIAKDVGLSHPTVLHHVGNRDALVSAVVLRAQAALQRDLLACFADLQGEPERLAELALARVDEALRTSGHARVLAWLALSDFEPQDTTHLRQLADVIKGAQSFEGTHDDARFTVLLASATMFGVAILGRPLAEQLGFTDPDAVLDRFRVWFARMIAAHLTR
jgi:AcrR family transcriptional regulator